LSDLWPNNANEVRSLLNVLFDYIYLMPPILPDYEYDIFISYRHNDNRSGWVTKFVEALQEELASTIKEPLSIYFDKNPHDGLLETHHVDKSLEGKLKCLIFIPIISQTYCDPKSFAWQHEFCAFNKLAQEDQLGRDIKLSNGNVASRILPIKIHELDADDSATVEVAIGGVLRAIEFIYKEPGVNRPLSASDNRKDNLNKTDYKNQVNKVANSIKEIMTSLKSETAEVIEGDNNRPPAYITDLRKRGMRKTSNAFLAALLLIVIAGLVWYKLAGSGVAVEPIDKSIAVLPFVDMSPNKDQEYLGDGLAESIITSLSNIKDLKVIGRTSSFQFKGDKVDLREIGERLGVSTILEGSVMKSNDKIRITAQLINVSDGAHLWSEKFDSDLKDIFSIQDQISKVISDRMKVSLIGVKNVAQTKTTIVEAYENFLRGTQIVKDDVMRCNEAIPFFEKAIQMDSAYLAAWDGLGQAYILLVIQGKMNADQAIRKLNWVTNEMIKIDLKSSEVHQLRFTVAFLLKWNWQEAEEEYSKSDKRPNFHHVSYQLTIKRDAAAARAEAQMLYESDPLNIQNVRMLSYSYYFTGERDKAYETINKILRYAPSNKLALFQLGQLKFWDQKYDLAIQYLREAGAESDLVLALCKAGKLSEAKALFSSKPVRGYGNRATVYACLGDFDEAFEELEQGVDEKDISCLWLLLDPESQDLSNDPRYAAFVKKLNLPA